MIYNHPIGSIYHLYMMLVYYLYIVNWMIIYIYIYHLPPMKGTIGNSIDFRVENFHLSQQGFSRCEVRTIGPALTLALAAASIFYDELRGEKEF